ncbi:hypothetical protein [Carboxylicivirga taeanensis]|uniref:hypothetical protein n=1 Tax=Carboxylicivirga taeanensis TaxID=1416875 RepID=UPI003F6DB89B
MATLSERFIEIGRGYERKSENYKCPHILGVDIKEKEKPFIVASGDHHSDCGAALISIDELLSDRWKEHIKKANCSDFVEQLRKSVENGEKFPQNIIVEIVNNSLNSK